MTAKAIIEIQEAATQIRAFEDVIPGFTPLQRLVYQDGAPVFHWSLRLSTKRLPDTNNPKGYRLTPIISNSLIANGTASSQGEAEAEARLALFLYQQVESSRKPPVVIEIDL